MTNLLTAPTDYLAFGPLLRATLVCITVVLLLLVFVALRRPCSPTFALTWTILRLLLFRGRRRPGVMTGVVFPINVADLTGPQGPAFLTAMLQHGGHLPPGVAVTAVRNSNTDLRDGVKGDKAIVEVEYNQATTEVPMRFFVKFNLQKLSAMRLLVETSEVCRCEALFYRHLAAEVAATLPSPKCYFVDYNVVTGEFVLVADVVCFGKEGVLPPKHRIRDETSLEEQRLFITVGAKVNAAFWGEEHPALVHIPRFDQTHQQMWVLAQLMAKVAGLRHTMQRTLKGRKVNEAFMTWRVPQELVGREAELIRDMPGILTSLCEDGNMVAFGHNDYTTDNAFFKRDRTGRLECGVVPCAPKASCSCASFCRAKRNLLETNAFCMPPPLRKKRILELPGPHT